MPSRTSFLAPGSLARRRLARAIHHRQPGVPSCSWVKRDSAAPPKAITKKAFHVRGCGPGKLGFATTAWRRVATTQRHRRAAGSHIPVTSPALSNKPPTGLSAPPTERARKTAAVGGGRQRPGDCLYSPATACWTDRVVHACGRGARCAAAVCATALYRARHTALTARGYGAPRERNAVRARGASHVCRRADRRGRPVGARRRSTRNAPPSAAASLLAAV